MSEHLAENAETDDRLCAEVDDWLNLVKIWGPADDGQTTRETFENIPKLDDFLHRLHDVLCKWHDTHIAVKSLPNIGQLLGRLCCNNVVLLTESTYRNLLKCILVLAPENPRDELEEKARRWAHSQIKNTAGYVPSEKPFKTVTEMTGVLPHEFNQTAINKFIDAIQKDLDRMCCRRWSSKTNSLIPVRSGATGTDTTNSHDAPNTSTDTSLHDVSEMCLPLLHIPQALPLVESLLACHSASITEELSASFLEKVTQLQKDAYFKETCGLDLSYRGRLQLWSRYLPALEQEVQILVEVTILHKPWCSRKEAVSIIQSRNLPQACVDNPAIHIAVTAMLKSILVSCHGNVDVLKLISLFNVAILEAVSCDHNEPVVEVCSLYSRNLRPLAQLIQVQPKGLSNAASHMQIQSICAIISTLKTRVDMLEIWWMLVQFEAWFYKAIELALIPELELDATLTFLCWYTDPISESAHQDNIKATLKDIITPLRILQSKVYLKSHDLQYALSASGDSHSSQFTHIRTPLLVLFLLKSSGGHLIAMDILNMAFPADSSTTTLYNFVDLLEVFLDVSGSVRFQQLGASKHRVLSDVITRLRDQCIHEHQRPASPMDGDMTKTDQLIIRCNNFISSLKR